MSKPKRINTSTYYIIERKKSQISNAEYGRLSRKQFTENVMILYRQINLLI